tara:strand:+ start:835 stop:1566 length:732 start_codon:yes stop_codon:yes gene_type:complete
MHDAEHVKSFLSKVDYGNKFYIDIGCSHEYNIPTSEIEDSDITIFCDCDTSKLTGYKKWESADNFNLVTEKITPENVVKIFGDITERKDPKLLDLDIDGYDFYVLEALLKNKYRPSLIMAEINEKIPPPIKFSVKYDPDYWHDTTHFYGMSLAKVEELFQEYRYDIVYLAYNNVYAVPKEKNNWLQTYSSKEAYDKFYRNANWQQDFPYNSNVAEALDMSAEDGVEYFNKYFAEYKGRYDIYI